MAHVKRRQPIGFRLAGATIDRLKRRAKEVGVAQTTLVERYIDEGLRMDEHPLVYFRQGELGRRPALLGTNLDIASVIETIRQNDNSIGEAAEYLELPAEQVEACLRYYVDYKGEVDALIERARAAADREQQRWRRQQEVLA